MTYRNDHDAAIARVDALQQENKKLADENSKLKQPTPARSGGAGLSKRKQVLLVAGVAICAVAGIAISAFAMSSPASRKQDAENVDAIDLRLAQLAHDRLATCADLLAPSPHLDETRADPRGAAASVDNIRRTTGCRRELDVFLSEGVISGTEREALHQWLVAEDTLDGAVTMLVTYYGSDPYALDGYTSARQLWLEYDRAYFQRNVALDGWRRSQ